jgi:antitoxin YefM
VPSLSAVRQAALRRSRRPGPGVKAAEACLCGVISDRRGWRWPCSWPLSPILTIIMVMEILPLAEVKAHLSELVAQVRDHHERVTVTVHGRPAAVLISVDDLESLEETLAVLADPATLRRLAASDAELARGEVIEADELAAVMAARRRTA